jgi:hypothetical protein
MAHGDAAARGAGREWREWWEAARARARASIARSPSAAMRFARRWSPGVMPPLLGSLLLLGALALSGQSTPHQPPLIAPQTLLKLLLTYMLAGTIYGCLLYFAASDLVWMCVLAVGVPVYLVLTSAVLWGLGTAIGAAICCIAFAIWYARKFTYTLPEGGLAVTTLGGAYARTLWQGRMLLAPGERVVAMEDASERRFTCPARRADIPNELGEIYQARASATVSYQLIPAEAHYVVLASDQWERDVHEQIGESLTQALGEWGAHLLMGDGTPPEQLLAKTLLRELRAKLRPRGIHVGWVSVRDIWLAPEGELLPADEPSETPPASRALIASTSTAPSTSPQASLAAQKQEDNASKGGFVQQGQLPSQNGDDTGPAHVLSADVLSDAYEAVREGRITDPETIRQIANAFLQVAADEEQSAAFPYDAMAAAHILLDRAKALERGKH